MTKEEFEEKYCQQNNSCLMSKIILKNVNSQV